MEIILETPVKAKLLGTSDEAERIKNALTYSSKTVEYQIKRHCDNHYWKSKNLSSWKEHLDKLKADLNKCLLWNENGHNYIRPGSIPYITQSATKIFNKLSYPEFKPLPWNKHPDFEPYRYQSDAVRELINAKHANISLPTGCGKSFILLMLARQMGLNTVVITPSQSIFNELLDEFEEKLGKKYVGGYGGGKKDINKKITIAIGKSLTMLKEDSEAHKFFSEKQAMFIDESHTFAAEQLEKVCHNVLKNVPYRFFVSATQTRNDGTEKLLQSIIGRNVLEMDLEEAIRGKYLCPLHFKILNTYSVDSRSIKDPMKCKRAHFLYNKNIAKLVAQIANASWRTRQQSTLVLVEELIQIAMLKELLEVPFTYAHAGSKKDAEKFGLEKVKVKDEVLKFNKGEAKVLIGTKAIATGTNIYPTHNTANWVGGSSEIVTKQGAMGRSTRKLKGSKFEQLHVEKLYTTIFDFKVKGVPMLNKQLDKRISWYGEAGGQIKYVG